jgi:uncharacterized Zn finger protein (UPF0148 family)
VTATYYCPICGHTLDELRCELKCPVCGYQEDCSDVALPMDALRERPSPEEAHAEDRRRGSVHPGRQPQNGNQ